MFHTVTSATPFCYAIHAAFTLPTAAFMRNYVQGRWVQVLHNGETLRPPISFGGDDIATRSCSDSCSVPTGPCRVILMHRNYVQGRWAQVLHNGVPQVLHKYSTTSVLEVTSLAIGGLRLIQHTAGGNPSHMQGRSEMLSHVVTGVRSETQAICKVVGCKSCTMGRP